MKIELYNRECLEKLKELPDDSVDAIVTDPPYFISFMNKGWDNEDSIASKKEFWAECLRVTKPGGYLLAFGHSRTHHRLFTAVEDGGWEIRDTIMWLYGSGFPKSLNIGKAIDKMAGRVDLSCDEVKLKLKTLYDKSGKSLGKISKECKFNASGYVKTNSNKPDPWTSTLPTLEKWEVISKVIGATEEEKNEVSTLLVSAQREVIGSKSSGLFNGGEGNSVGGTIAASVDITIANSNEAKEWEGWGTALKPAHEPICMARKPLSEKSVAENVLKWGTGGINIDTSRVGTEVVSTHNAPKGTFAGGEPERGSDTSSYTEHEGRFPANIILECICENPEVKEAPKSGHWPVVKTTGFGEFGGGKSSYEGTGPKESGNMIIHTDPNCPCYILDEQTGVSKSQKRLSKHNKKTEHTNTFTPPKSDYRDDNTYADSGGASRFFYCAKVSGKERNKGLEELKETTDGKKGNGLGRKCSHCGTSMLKPKDCKCETPDWIIPAQKNNHPTVKPIALMEYLIKLVSKEEATILDPFMGSGSTGIAAKKLNRNFVGIEMDEGYYTIASKRMGVENE